MEKIVTTKQFNKLSRKKRAVLIAKDVILQLKLKNIHTSHTYIDININEGEFIP